MLRAKLRGLLKAADSEDIPNMLATLDPDMSWLKAAAEEYSMTLCVCVQNKGFVGDTT